MRFNSTVVFLVSLLFLAGCSNAQQEGQVIAEVNGSKLTYDFILDQFPQEYRSTLTDEQLARAIDAWIETELFYQEALKHNLHEDKSIKNIIAQKSKDIVASRYIDMSISANVDVTDQMVDSLYQSNKEMFITQEDMFTLRHIVLSSQNAANAVHSRLKKGDSFISLVKDYSEDDQSRKLDGSVGMLPASALEANMIDALKALDIGQFTGPLQSQSGFYHIFLLEDRKDAGVLLPLDEIRDEIAQSVIAERQQSSYKDLVNRLTVSANIKRYPINEAE
ncbi:MAG: hypothetical protein GY839_14420 [candidate division Zixibacteria bacterium]|nr:hypothetical protein [candidate division Zixibacteria bacterium]